MWVPTYLCTSTYCSLCRFFFAMWHFLILYFMCVLLSFVHWYIIVWSKKLTWILFYHRIMLWHLLQENEDSHPAVRRVSPRSTKSLTKKYKESHPGIQRVSPRSTKTFTQVDEESHPGVRRVSPRKMKSLTQEYEANSTFIVNYDTCNKSQLMTL